MTADRIELRGLHVDAVHGVLDQERRRPQPFEVDLDLELDTTEAARRDDLALTADYAAAVTAARSVLLGPPRALLETLADEVAAAVLADPRVQAVTVAVRKLAPPLDVPLRSAAVRITRYRP